MRTRLLAALCALFLAAPFTFGDDLTITPTTTLAAETGNNTSTANSFVTSTNGNMGAGNVSKRPLRDLMYPGFTGQVYVNWVPWWGQSNHVNIGYSEANPAQLDAQVVDMMSRGVDGLIVDWWHAGQLEINTELMLTASENHPPFTFALMYDASQLSGQADPTQRFINDLNFAAQRYYSSPAYIRIGGRPLMVTFGLESYAIDWARVQAGITGNPLLLFRNSSGYSKPMSAGAFAWGASQGGTSYLDYFYQHALLAPPTMLTWGAGVKGFDDSIAPWGQHRYADQQCGQHWLAQLADATTWYLAFPTRLNAMQIATWNDYEEGTEIESGIDNCLSVSAAMSGSSVIWAVTGQENTVHHYTVFISTDGTNLMALADVPAGTSSVDLSQYQLAPGTYTLFVKAVGQASIRNQMSGAVSYTVVDSVPTAALSVTPNSGIAPIAVTASTAASTAAHGTITSSSIDFGDGAVMSGPTAAHTYNASGNYTVTATVTDSYGMSATTTRAVNIAANQPPQAVLSVTPASGVAPVTVTASTAASSDPDGSVASSRIDFGDGASSAGPTASHTYNAAGTYTITGTVTDNLGASSTSTGSVSVTPGSLTLTSPVLGNATTNSPVHIVASATSGNPISSIWIYIDNVVQYQIHGSSVDTYLNLSPGLHSISAQAWDTSGNLFLQRGHFTVNAPPVAALSLSQTGVYAPATVTASTTGSTPGSGTLTGSSIEFGDGTVMNGPSASHAYEAGSYTVTATVTDSNGLSATASQAVTVNPRTVTISYPSDGSSAHKAVHVIASAASGATVSAMWVYVDYSVAYKTNQSSLDTYLKLGRGTHVITVKAWDVTGALFTSAVTVNGY